MNHTFCNVNRAHVHSELRQASTKTEESLTAIVSCDGLIAVGARKLERDQILNTVIRGSLGARSRCPMVCNYSNKSCPVDRFKQYLNSACSHHSQFTPVHFNLAQLNSKQPPLSLYDFRCHCHIRYMHLRVVTWDHRTKYPLDKGRAGPQSL